MASATLMVDGNLPPPREQRSSRGMATGTVTAPLLDAFHRLVSLLADERDIPILAPVIQRETIYRLLIGDQGARLRQIAATRSQSQQIASAGDWLKENFAEPVRIDDLAAQANMSTSTFHSHFRSLTALSPLQYQKRLRLHEARRLMLAEQLDATTASVQVGYESASQYSRVYSRQFGAPPLRDSCATSERCSKWSRTREARRHRAFRSPLATALVRSSCVPGTSSVGRNFGFSSF